MNTAERLVQVRKEHHYNRREAAAELGVPYTTLTKYENGTRNPPYSFLYAFAKKFGVTVEYLACYSDYPEKSEFGNGIYGSIALEKSISDLIDNVGYRINQSNIDPSVMYIEKNGSGGSAKVYKDDIESLYSVISEFVTNATNLLFNYAITREMSDMQDNMNLFTEFANAICPKTNDSLDSVSDSDTQPPEQEE